MTIEDDLAEALSQEADAAPPLGGSASDIRNRLQRRRTTRRIASGAAAIALCGGAIGLAVSGGNDPEPKNTEVAGQDVSAPAAGAAAPGAASSAGDAIARTGEPDREMSLDGAPQPRSRMDAPDDLTEFDTRGTSGDSFDVDANLSADAAPYSDQLADAGKTAADEAVQRRENTGGSASDETSRASEALSTADTAASSRNPSPPGRVSDSTDRSSEPAVPVPASPTPVPATDAPTDLAPADPDQAIVGVQWTEADREGARRALADARQRWDASALVGNYRLEVRNFCFGFCGTTTTTVTDDSVTDLTSEFPLDPTGDIADMAITVERLHDAAAASIDDDDRFQLVFDTNGVPVIVQRDPELTTIDEERGYEVLAITTP